MEWLKYSRNKVRNDGNKFRLLLGKYSKVRTVRFFKYEMVNVLEEDTINLKISNG